MQNNLQHVGVLGMHWGKRKSDGGGSISQQLRAAHNARVVKSGVGTLKPTYQYRDSNGHLVSRYGKGKYGGPKPVLDIKGDNKFMRDVNRLSKTVPPSKASMDQADSFIRKQKNTKLSSFSNASIKVGKGVVTMFAALVVGNFIADKVMWLSGGYGNL